MLTTNTNICIIGDSFAGHRHSNDSILEKSASWSWVNLIEDNSTGLFSGQGFPGQSFWHQRRWFLNWQDNRTDRPETVLIFVHTNSWRIPHEKDVPVTGQVLSANKHSRDNELLNIDPSGSLFDLAKTFYVSNLYVGEFYQFAHLAWLQEIPRLTTRYKKVIHLFGFENKMSDLPNRQNSFCIEQLITDNSIVVRNELMSLSMAEKGNTNWGGTDDHGKQNHLGEHNNIQLAQFVQYLINEQAPGTSVEIPVERWKLKDPNLIKLIRLNKEV
jgi:hypothetical protein